MNASFRVTGGLRVTGGSKFCFSNPAYSTHHAKYVMTGTYLAVFE